jgi:hypothetical protein
MLTSLPWLLQPFLFIGRLDETISSKAQLQSFLSVVLDQYFRDDHKIFARKPNETVRYADKQVRAITLVTDRRHIGKAKAGVAEVRWHTNFDAKFDAKVASAKRPFFV